MADFDPMQVVARTDECRVNDVADQLRITIGGASKAIDRIAGAGLCVRRLNPQDRRSSIIELTDQGTIVLQKASHVFERELSRWFGTLSQQSLRQLAGTVAKLRSAAPAADTPTYAEQSLQQA